MKHFLLSFMALVLVISQASAQQRTVTGKVTTAEDGLAFPGVSVFVKGTTVGVITDSNGNYSLSIPSEAETLVFSFIGYTSQEKEIGNNSVINVAMTPDVTELGEVVVTAFGTTTKRDFTGSASSIASEDLKLRPVTNPIESI